MIEMRLIYFELKYLCFSFRFEWSSCFFQAERIDHSWTLILFNLCFLKPLMITLYKLYMSLLLFFYFSILFSRKLLLLIQTLIVLLLLFLNSTLDICLSVSSTWNGMLIGWLVFFMICCMRSIDDTTEIRTGDGTVVLVSVFGCDEAWEMLLKIDVGYWLLFGMWTNVHLLITFLKI
jgi:hypothetical protein